MVHVKFPASMMVLVLVNNAHVMPPNVVQSLRINDVCYVEVLVTVVTLRIDYIYRGRPLISTKLSILSQISRNLRMDINFCDHVK